MELLTIKETAETLRVSQITVRRYIAAGTLAAERVGRGIRVRREAIEEFVKPVVPPSDKRKPTDWTRKPANYPDKDLAEIWSPTSPGGVIWVPLDQLDEYLEHRGGNADETFRKLLGIQSAAVRGEAPTRRLTLREAVGDIIGIGRSHGPSDVSANKYKYLADAYEPENG